MGSVTSGLEKLKAQSLRNKIIMMMFQAAIVCYLPVVFGVTYYYARSVERNTVRQGQAVGSMVGKYIHDYSQLYDNVSQNDGNTDGAATVDVKVSKARITSLLSKVKAVDNVVFAATYGREGRLSNFWALEAYNDRVPTIVTREEFEENNYLGIVRVPLLEQGGGTILIGVDMMPIRRLMRRNIAFIYTIIVILFLVLVLSIFVFSKKVILEPLESLNYAIGRINRDGVLAVDIEPRCNDEIGMLTLNFAGMVKQLKVFVSSTDEVSDQMIKAGQAARAVTQSVANGAKNVGAYIATSSSTMEELLASYNVINQNMENLSNSAGVGLDSVNEATQLSRAMSTNVQGMSNSIANSADIIAKMGRNVEDSAKNVGELSDSIVSTSASMLEIERSVNEVENNAQSSAAQTREVQAKVAQSTEAIKRTTEGIANIRRSSKEAASVINDLGLRIGDIGSIVHVIEDITKQTNLLALNAAIIAAQAGEHGRSFSVVSDEITALAQRTRHSTTEIADLIESIQEESRHAVMAMEQDMRYIDQGVVLGENAESLLNDLQKSVVESTTMAERIAVSAVEQSNAIKTVNKSIENVAHSIQLITGSLDEQSDSARHIVINTNELNKSSKELAKAANEQSNSMTGIVEAITRINTKVLEIKEDQKRRIEDTKSVLELIRSIKNVCQQQGVVTANLGSAMDPIDETIANLQELLSHFSV